MKTWGEIMRGPGAVEPKDIERFERSQGNVDRCIGAALRELYERGCEGSAQTQRKLEQKRTPVEATQSLRNSTPSEGLTLEQRIERLANAFLGLEERVRVLEALCLPPACERHPYALERLCIECHPEVLEELKRKRGRLADG